ncbi:MAG: sulfatase-like hydrolase/transferase [Acidobacteria bacterium]|nr:sulfatase-like hydrolase/transferase [Acidobacteriota bacterium]
MNRRSFLTTPLAAAAAPTSAKPNILWITCEDIGPHLGAFGCPDSNTPNLDRLASQGMRFPYVWSIAPVCAPARTSILTSMYPQSIGAQHMRSTVTFPSNLRTYPELLRQAGYYCTNNSKTDYNLNLDTQLETIWDDSSPKAHWRNRPTGKPFFAVFNFIMTHESQIRLRPHTFVHDPAKVRIPPYHPDNIETRQGWAQYHDKITDMDREAGKLLQEIEATGEAENTIVFFYGDNGPGLPRLKRDAYNAGFHVPLIVYLPNKWQHLAQQWQPGQPNRRLTQFIDFAPTVLSIAGLQPPTNFQGRAFLGPHAKPAPNYLHGMMDRMGERYDLIRSMRNHRYVYIRNFMPHRAHGQYGDYSFQTPTTRAWRALFDAGKLNPTQAAYWMPKAPEELYDLEADPDEINNLAKSPSHRATLEKFRAALRTHIFEIRDTGFLPESELHSRSTNTTPYAMARGRARYPLEEIFPIADLASHLDPATLPRLQQSATHKESAIRYWAVLGILMRGREAIQQSRGLLTKALNDPSPAVRIVAAEALSDADVLITLADPRTNPITVVIQALSSLDELPQIDKSAIAKLASYPAADPAAKTKYLNLYPTLRRRLLAKFP